MNTTQITKHCPSTIPSVLPRESIARSIRAFIEDRFEKEGRKIRLCNPLNPKEPPDVLLKRIEASGIKNWDLVYDAQSAVLTIWPHLQAAGREFSVGPGLPSREGRPPRVSTINNGQIGTMSSSQVEALIASKKNYQKDKNWDFWTNSKTGNTIRIDRVNKFVEIRSSYGEKESKRDREQHRQNLQARLNKKEITQNQYYSELESYEERTWNRKDYAKATTWRLSYGKQPPKDGGSNGPSGKPSGGKTPGEAQFRETVKSTGLAKSYNSSNPNNQIQGKGAGQIGGVACGSTPYMEGLFETPEALLENEHFFYLPKLDQEKMPFSNAQLSQILREVACGIYNGAVPWFSLHFSAKGDLYPVIHPIYANTLVGRVIGMLDYIMKGYLNGGVFEENFVDLWAKEREKDPDWSNKSAWEKLIDFEEYCKKHLTEENKNYQSLRRMQQNAKKLHNPTTEELQQFLTQHGLGNSINAEALEKRLSALGIISKQDEPEILKNFSGFKNSFRIIANQKSVQKEGPLFVIDSDFDVEYTIVPSPQYKEALDLYQRQHGSLPPSYQKMLVAYDMMKEKIHDHMVKMPLCREYFSMLGAINFFSSYFSTLKTHRKIPLLPPIEAEKTGCPSLFPHLPIKTLREVKLEFALTDVFHEIVEARKIALGEYLVQSYSKEVEPAKELVQAIEEGIRKSILKGVKQTTPRTLEDIEKSVKNSSFETIAMELLDKIKSEFKSLGKVKSNDPFLNTLASQFLEMLKNGQYMSGIGKLGKRQYETISIGNDITEEELEDGKKVVGGCGLRLEAQPVKASPAANQIMQAYGPSLYSLAPETWMEISKDGKATGSLFRLFFADLPSLVEEDYGWMAELLHRQTEEDRARIDIVEAMADGNREEFMRLIQNEKVRDMKDCEGRSLLHQAAMLSDPFFLESLIKKGVVQTADHQGYLPIHYAAINGAVKQLESLYQADKKSLDAKSRNGTTPLVTAIQGGEAGAVRFLLSKKALLQATSDGNNPLHWAMQSGDLAIIEELLNDGRSSNLLNQYSEEMGYPLIQACELDSAKLIEKLMTLGADPKAKRKDGTTAIEIAIRRNCIPVLDELLKKAKPSANSLEAAMEEGSIETLKRMIPLPEFYQHRNDLGETLLHRAIANGNVAAALLIISECQDRKYLEASCSLAVKLGLWEVIEAFHKKGLTLNPESLLCAGYHSLLNTIFEPLKPTPEEMQRYLLAAAESGNYEAITHILEPKGAQLEDFRGPKGWSLAHYLVRCDGLYLFKLLAAKSKKIVRRLPQEGNKTLAYHAAEQGSERILQFLLEQYKKEKISLEGQYQDRHLFYAVIESGNEKMCQWMLENFEGLANAKLDAKGTRAIHLAAKMGHIPILKLLDKHMADLHALDQEKRTALDLSLRTASNKASEFLRSKNVAESDTKEEKLIPSPEVLPLHFYASEQDTQKIRELLDQHPEWVDAEDSQGCTPLFHAIEGHLKLGTPLENIELLIKRGASLRHSSHKLITPLVLACLRGSLSLVKLLVECGADPNQAATDDRMTALDLSIGLGYREISRYLLMQGAKANSPNKKGTTTAHLAVEAGDLSLLRLMAAKGIPLNIKNRNGMEPIHKAAAMGKAKTVEILLALGASAIDSPIDAQDEKAMNGATPLHLASMSGDAETIDILLKQHADLDASAKGVGGLLSFAATRPESKAALKQLESCRIAKDPAQLRQAIRYAIAQDNIDSMILLYKDKIPLQTDLMDGHTGLHIACMHGSLQCARWLLEQGADPLQTSATGENALEIAAAKSSQELFRLLLEEAPWDIDQSNARGETLLHMAAKSGKLGNAMLLLLQGASLSARDEYGFTPLHAAARNGHAAVVNFLLACGADPQSKSHMSQTPLDLAQNKDEQTKTALKQAADLPKQATRLHLALKLGNPLAVLALTHLEDCNQADKDGLTPLHHAAQTGQTQALLYLLQAGASVNIKDNSGHTPLWHAKRDRTIARLLIQAGAEDDLHQID